MSLANPQHSDAVVNSATAPRKTFLRPYWSLTLPASGIARTWPSEYTVIVQPLRFTRACRSCCSAGSAVATMVWSTELMNNAIDTIVKTRRAPGATPAPGSDPRGPGAAAGCCVSTDDTLLCLPIGN